MVSWHWINKRPPDQQVKMDQQITTYTARLSHKVPKGITMLSYVDI